MSVLAVDTLSLDLAGRRVLDRISASFYPGRVTAILGPNGAGKSTLLACLAGLRVPDEGTVLLGGRPRAALGARQRVAHII